MISSELILQLIQVVTLYCSIEGPGANVELTVYKNWNGDRDRSVECFKKIWGCGHDTQDASTLVTLTHGCIGKHMKGELK